MDFEHKPVAGVYFNSQQALYQAREQLQQLDIRHYEADIRPVERYLTERYLTGPVTIKINADNEFIKNKSKNFLVNPHIKPQVHPEKNRRQHDSAAGLSGSDSSAPGVHAARPGAAPVPSAETRVHPVWKQGYGYRSGPVSGVGRFSSRRLVLLQRDNCGFS